VPAYGYRGLKAFRRYHRFGPALKQVIYWHRSWETTVKIDRGMWPAELPRSRGFPLASPAEAGDAGRSRAMRTERKSPIVFLEGIRHPMNLRFDLRYLLGGDAIVGPELRGAMVYTNHACGYHPVSQHRQVAQGISKFNLSGRTPGHGRHAGARTRRRSSGRRWLQRHPQGEAAWLEGVMTRAWPRSPAGGACDRPQR